MPRVSRSSPSLIHRRHDEEDDAYGDAANAKNKQRVRRRNDLDVQAVGVVPPVVEGRRGEHRDAAPGRNKGAERGAEAQHRDRFTLQLLAAAKRRVQDQVSADHRRNHTAGIDQQMRRGEERIASDGTMPRDIPRAAKRGRGDRERAGPHRPRDARRTFGARQVGGKCCDRGSDGTHLTELLIHQHSTKWNAAAQRPMHQWPKA